MNRNHCLRRRILILLASIVLVTGCNLDSDGIFMRISESEETVEVGAITLIATKDDAFYALTTEKGLQKYDPETKQWTKIPSDAVMHVATDGSSLFYATRAGEDEENSVFAYNLTTSGITPKDDQYVIAMSPTNDLMLVKDAVDADIYSVIKASNYDSVLVSDLTYSAPPRLIAQDSETFIVSGVNGPSYTHRFVFVDDTTTNVDLTSTDTALDDYPIVAFHYDDTTDRLVAVASDGKIWKGTPNSLSTSTSVSLPERNPETMPYPAFHYEDKLYLQNDNKRFQVISPEGTVSEVSGSFASEFTSIGIFSFLEGDSGIIYAGTTANGIWQIDMVGDTAEML